MAEEKKFFETGSDPYRLNRDNSAKDFSLNESTNPSFGLLDTLSKFIIIEENTQILEPFIKVEMQIESIERK